MTELTSRPEYASGELPFPRRLDPANAVAIAADLHAAVDQGVEARAEAARQQGATIACGPGCNKCCEQLVMIWVTEAQLIASWLDEPEQAEIKRWFLEAYPSWKERSTAAIDKVVSLTRAGDAKGQFAALVAHWHMRVLCAFNRDGLCTIYPVRPILCRNCHALDTSDNCHPDDKTGTAATSLHFVPLEDFLKRTRGLSKAMHHALGGGKNLAVPLCQAVYERLSSSTSSSSPGGSS